MLEVISGRSLETVCGYNFITEFDSWRVDFQHLTIHLFQAKHSVLFGDFADFEFVYPLDDRHQISTHR